VPDSCHVPPICNLLLPILRTRLPFLYALGTMSELDDAFQVPEPIDGPDKEANEKKLQQQLHEYRRVLESEFARDSNYSEGKLDPDEVMDKTQELLTQAVPRAVARLMYLCDHGANEQVQYKAAVYILDRSLGKDTGLIADPFEKDLNKNPA